MLAVLEQHQLEKKTKRHAEIENFIMEKFHLLLVKREHKHQSDVIRLHLMTTFSEFIRLRIVEQQQDTQRIDSSSLPM